MNKAILLLFSCLILLSACKRDSECVPPPCPQPDLNKMLSIELNFCTDTDNQFCFSGDQLYQIAIVSKFADDDSVIAVDSIFNLIDFNYSISLGAGGIPLTTNELNTSTTAFNFEVVVLQTQDRFTISDIEVIDLNKDKFCDCPSFQIVELKLNDEIIRIDAAHSTVELRK